MNRLLICRLLPLMLAGVLVAGCGSSEDDGPRVRRSQQRSDPGYQRSRDHDAMSEEAAGMAKEDSDRLEEPKRSRPERRPEPVRRRDTSPVDQPRIR